MIDSDWTPNQPEKRTKPNTDPNDEAYWTDDEKRRADVIRNSINIAHETENWLYDQGKSYLSNPANILSGVEGLGEYGGYVIAGGVGLNVANAQGPLQNITGLNFGDIQSQVQSIASNFVSEDVAVGLGGAAVEGATAAGALFAAGSVALDLVQRATGKDLATEYIKFTRDANSHFGQGPLNPFWASNGFLTGASYLSDLGNGIASGKYTQLAKDAGNAFNQTKNVFSQIRGFV
jgi:hypothetical protein